MTTTPASGAADRAIEGCPELNMGNYDEVGVERLNDWAIRANDEIDRLHALAAGQATAAQQGAYAALSESFLEIPDVQDESGINAYYSREVVLECIDAALASHGQAPAQVLHLVQDAFAEVAMAYPKAFALHKVGLADTAVRKALDATPSPQAADSVLEDAMRYRWLREGNDAKHGAAWHVAVNLYGCEWDAAIDAAMDKGATQ